MRAFILSLVIAAAMFGQNSVSAGRLHIDPPTLENLGFWWPISGDANRNGRANVEYKRTTETVWKQALPLLRIGGEQVGRDAEHLKYIVPEGFAGSILNLTPDTEYDVRLAISDPDGTSGETSRTLRLRTRSEPHSYSAGRTLHVYSPEYKGPREEPAFTGILEAYYGAGLGDWSVVWERKAKPGDTLLVHAGLYRPERLNYVDPLAAPFEGTFNLTLKGTAERPITIKAAGDGEVVFDGAGNHVLFDVMGTAHHIFDGITFRNRMWPCSRERRNLRVPPT